MSKPKSDPAPAAIELPKSGGSYTVDPKTGKRARTAATKPAPMGAAARVSGSAADQARDEDK